VEEAQRVLDGARAELSAPVVNTNMVSGYVFEAAAYVRLALNAKDPPKPLQDEEAVRTLVRKAKCRAHYAVLTPSRSDLHDHNSGTERSLSYGVLEQFLLRYPHCDSPVLVCVPGVYDTVLRIMRELYPDFAISIGWEHPCRDTIAWRKMHITMHDDLPIGTMALIADLVDGTLQSAVMADIRTES
jgi:hypothetical protein